MDTDTNNDNNGHEVADDKDDSKFLIMTTDDEEVSHRLNEVLSNYDELSPILLIGIYELTKALLRDRAMNVIHDIIDSNVFMVKDVRFAMELPESTYELWYGNSDKSEVKAAIYYMDGHDRPKIINVPARWLGKDFDYKADFEKYEPINREHNNWVIEELARLHGNDDETIKH